MISCSVKCRALALLVLIAHRRHVCTADAPISRDLFGKGIETERHCESPGGTARGEFKLLNWGLFIRLFLYSDPWDAACPASMVIEYRRGNRPAVIYYRAEPKPEFFKDIAPAEYRKYKNGGSPKWPCDNTIFPIQSVHS